MRGCRSSASRHRKRNRTTRTKLDLRLPTSRPISPALAAGLSFLVHLLVVVLVIWAANISLSATRPDTRVDPHAPGKRGGGSGGNRVAYITVPSVSSAARPAVPARAPKRPAPSKPVTRTPRPVVAKAPAALMPDTTMDTAALAGRQAPDSTVGGRDAGIGTGQGGGEGSGVGRGVGTSDTGIGKGAGRRATPPEPRQLVLPPSDFPKELRGRTLRVTFWVNAGGRVERLDVAPAIEHSGFAKRFEETMRNYRFRPARSPDGLPIAGSITVNVAFFQ